MGVTELLGFTEFHVSAFVPGDAEVGAKLKFELEEQEAGNWCWAAVGSSVSKFYVPASTWTQCTLVEAELGVAGCCVSPTPFHCNQTHYLSATLTEVGHLNTHGVNASSYEVVRQEIDDGNPIGMAIKTGSKAHYCVLYGYAGETDPIMFFQDPRGKYIDLEYGEDVSSAYSSGARWTYSYLTQP